VGEVWPRYRNLSPATLQPLRPTLGYAIKYFTYDSVNRLKCVGEKLNRSGSGIFNQPYNYDRYGNRTLDWGKHISTKVPDLLDNKRITACLAGGSLRFRIPKKSIGYRNGQLLIETATGWL
jgi:hypothetical protein